MRHPQLWLAGAIILIAIGIVYFSFNKPTGLSAGEVSFTQLSAGSYSSVTSRINYRVTSQSDLDALWQLTGAGGTAPAVDFSHYDVYGIFAGQEPSAGYAIAVSGIRDTANRQVAITVTVPGPNCSATQATTQPFQIIEVPTSTLTLAHTDTAAAKNCY